MVCRACEEIFNSLTIKEIKKIGYIKTDLIESSEGKWYRSYCTRCGSSRRYDIE